MVMKRRNVYNFIATNKLRRALKRNKTNDGVGFIVRLFGGIGMLILFDFLSDLRVELLYPFYLFVSEFNDIFRFKGFLYLLCYMFLALSVDMLCYYFLTIQWLLFTSSSIVWFQFTWDAERGYSSSFLPVWLTLCGFEFFVRGRHIKLGYSITQEISRPFAAHGVGHPIFMLCFFCKNFIFYRIKVFRRRGIRRENEALMKLMRDAISTPAISIDSSDNRISDNPCDQLAISGDSEAEVSSNGHTFTGNGVPSISTHSSAENGFNQSGGGLVKHQNGHPLSPSSTKLISNQFPSSTLNSSLSSSTSISSLSPTSSAGTLVTSGRRLSNRSPGPETLLYNRILVLIKKPLSYYDSLQINKKLKCFAGYIVHLLGIGWLAEQLYNLAVLVLSIFRFSLFLSDDLNESSPPTIQESNASAISSTSSAAQCSEVDTMTAPASNNSAMTPATPTHSTSPQCNGHLNGISASKDCQIDGQVNKRKNSLETSNSKQKSNKQTSRAKAFNSTFQAALSGAIDSEVQQQFETILKAKEDEITNLKYQNNKLKCDVEITQQARDDLTLQLKDAEKSEKEADKRLKNAQNEIQTLQKRIQALNQTKQQDKQTIQKLEKSLEEERKKHRLTAEQQSQAEARAASAIESFNKANSFVETWKNKCRDSCNQQRKEFQVDISSLQQELGLSRANEIKQEQIIRELRERNSRLTLIGNIYQEKSMTLEKQLSCMSSEKFDLNLIISDRENEIHELRSKLARFTSNIPTKPFASPTGNGFPCSTDFDAQIATNRELVNRCFSSCSPGNGQSQAQRAISPSAFSTPTPPLSMLGQLSVPNISPGLGTSAKLNSTSGFHLNPTDSGDLIRTTFRLSRDSQIWPQNSSTTAVAAATATAAPSTTGPGSGSTISRLCDNSNLGAVGSERESANGRHSSQSNCSINNRINGQPPGPSIGNGFSTVLPTSASSSSSPLGSSSIVGNGLAGNAAGTLPGKIGSSSVNPSTNYDDFFGDDSVFDLPTVSNNSQGFF